jgi:predicted nucleic acid-binding protein
VIVAAGFLLDTNVISETRKTRADTGVMAFLSGAEAARLFLSVLTIGELHKGVEAKRRTDPGAADRLGEWVDGIETTFADRVLPIDMTISRLWGCFRRGAACSSLMR